MNDCVEVCGTRPRIRRPWERCRLQVDVAGKSVTQQAHKDQTDINAIVERFHRTGIMPQSARQPIFADVTGLQVDLTEAINRSRETLEIAVKMAKDQEKERNKPKEEPAKPELEEAP